jgi:hypothetical protein
MRFQFERLAVIYANFSVGLDFYAECKLETNAREIPGDTIPARLR